MEKKEKKNKKNLLKLYTTEQTLKKKLWKKTYLKNHVNNIPQNHSGKMPSNDPFQSAFFNRCVFLFSISLVFIVLFTSNFASFIFRVLFLLFY